MRGCAVSAGIRAGILRLCTRMYAWKQSGKDCEDGRQGNAAGQDEGVGF